MGSFLTAALPAPASPAAPHWEGGGDHWRLVLAGDWSDALPAPPAALRAEAGTRISVDMQALPHWQPPLAGALWQLLAPLARAGVQLDLSLIHI